jgi:hypothetical protein
MTSSQIGTGRLYIAFKRRSTRLKSPRNVWRVARGMLADLASCSSSVMPGAWRGAGRAPRRLRVRKAGGAPCLHVQAAAERMLRAIDEQITALRATRRQMRRTLRQWADTLEHTPPGRQARLLETLPASSAGRR